MTDRTRRALAERYNNGTMAPNERADLENRMQHDARLRSFVEAEQIIGTAFDRGAKAAAVSMAVDHAATRATVMAHLASGAGTGTAAHAVGVSLLTKIIVFSAIGLGAAGGYIAIQHNMAPTVASSPSARGSAARTEPPKPDTAATNALPEAITPQPAGQDSQATAAQAIGGSPRPVAPKPANTAGEQARRSQPSTTAPAEATPSQAVAPAQPTPPPANPPVKRVPPRVTQDSSVRIKITVPRP